MPPRVLLFLCIFFIVAQANSQCITVYPYTEGFEASTGNWTSGGTGNDWAWGAPSKAFIMNAGGGSKCWVTGGLTGSFYNNGERSFVVSPCFDFTGLNYPMISFKIYWESEAVYDGTTFQSSIDNGSSWVNVGSEMDATNCMTQNWFNSGNILNLSTLANPKSGWAGSVMPSSGPCQGGNGSNGWVIAKHCLQNLAGQPNVRFRFAFGAGTTCNTYDGFAFDDILIEDALANVADFSYNCSGSPLQYQFNNTSSPCPSNIVWNFGDPASGSNNGTGQLNPTHIFSTPGTYLVTLTVNGPCNGSSTIIKTISTIEAGIFGTSPLCAGDTNGSISAVSTNTTGVTLYSLSPGGTGNNNGLFTGLPGGNYTVTVSDAIGCSLSTSTSLNSPQAMTWGSATATGISCAGMQDGKVVVLANGGTGAKTYTLLPGGLLNSSGQFLNLPAANYTVVASDANGCTISTYFLIQEPLALSMLASNHQNPQCFADQSGSIQVNMSGGTGTLHYNLQPGNTNNTNGLFSNLGAGAYTLTCTDANGCSFIYTTTLTEPFAIVLDSVKAVAPGCDPNNDGSVIFYAHGGTSPLNYSIGGSFGTSNNFSNMTSNTYTLVVKDANGCSVSSLLILQSENSPVWQKLEVYDISCANKKDGVIEVEAISNTPIQSYVLMPGNLANNQGIFNNLSAGNYFITVLDANGCTNTQSLTVESPEPLLMNWRVQQQDSCGSSGAVILTIDVEGGTSPYLYHLDPGNKTQTSNIFTILSGAYQIMVSDENQCSSSLRIEVPESVCCDALFLPNAFSPNGDGLNEEFVAKNTAGTELLEFIVANRWGQVVFKAQNSYDSWNGHYKGEDAEMGYYYYFFKFRCKSSGKDIIRKGDVLLIR